MELFEGVNAKSLKAGKAEELARPAAGRAPQAPHHRRREERPGGRPRRGAADPPRPRHRQRHPAGRHEGRRRAVRLRPDAAAVRAAVRRGHEDRRRLPRTAHGEGRRRGQGHHRAGHRPRRRPRHRQEPRRHHPVQQRLQRRQPRHQAAGLRDPGRRRGAPGRRHRHVRPAGEVHGDHEGEPGGAQPAQAGRRLPGHPRRRRPDPRLRRAGPARDLRGRGPLRPRRLRGPAPDGRPDRASSAASPAPTLPELKQRRVPARRRRRRGRGAPGGGPRPLRRRHRQPGPDAAVLGHPGHQGHPARGVRLLAGRGRPVQGPVGPQAGPHRRRPDLRGAGRDRGPARGCAAGWTSCRPRTCWRRPSSTATSRASPRATT